MKTRNEDIMMQQLMHRRAALKDKLRKCQRVFGGWTCFSHPSPAEIFAKMGTDFVGIDMEHTPIDEEHALRIIALSQGAGGLCLPRVSGHDPQMIKRLLDSGADGIIVPLVNTREQAEQIFSWCAYPPVGKRSFGVARGQGYGLDYDIYTSQWNDAFSLVVQIETREAVANIEDILSVDGIDAVMVGPYDISGSLGIPGQLDHPKVQEARQKVIRACQKSGRSCGTQIVDPNMANVQSALDEGFNFIILGSDLFALWKWAEGMRDLMGTLRK